MDSKRVLELIFWFILVFGIGGILAIVMVFYPHQIVRVQGKIYRKWYKELFNWKDDQVNNVPMLPTDRFVMGNRADFIREAPENPNKFTRLVTVYRLLGIFLAILLAITLVLMIIGILFMEIEGM